MRMRATSLLLVLTAFVVVNSQGEAVEVAPVNTDSELGASSLGKWPGEAVRAGAGSGSSEPNSLAKWLGEAVRGGAGSGSGSGSGSKPLGPLKKPYHQHMKHNKPIWQAAGGWTVQKESMIAVAKAELARANKFVKKKRGEKEIAELGCPCHGEKYYSNVWNPKKVSAFPQASKGSGSGKKKKGCNPTDPEQNCDDDPKFGIKAMLKKYGKLGPQSSWTPTHEKKRQDAKKDLKVAEREAHAAFIVALPEFKRMQQEMPEFFTNGKCKCPSWWTVQDAVRLAAKVARDKEEDLYKHKRMLWAKEAKNNGEEAREAAAEEARMKAAKASKGPPVAATAPKSMTVQDVLLKEMQVFESYEESSRIGESLRHGEEEVVALNE